MTQGNGERHRRPPVRCAGAASLPRKTRQLLNKMRRESARSAANRLIESNRNALECAFDKVERALTAGFRESLIGRRQMAILPRRHAEMRLEGAAEVGSVAEAEPVRNVPNWFTSIDIG